MADLRQERLCLKKNLVAVSYELTGWNTFGISHKRNYSFGSRGIYHRTNLVKAIVNSDGFIRAIGRKGDWGMKKTTIFFPFEPVPKGRPRFTRKGHSYTPKTTLEYEEKISEYYKSQTDEFYDTAIKVKLVFNMPIPKSTTKKNRNLIMAGQIKCTKHTGDVDNLAKSVLDSLNGVAFEDDCLVTRLTIIKQYATEGNVGTEMEISEDIE